MKKTMTAILAVMLVFLMVSEAPAESYLSPYELLGKIMEAYVYLMKPDVTLKTAMVQEDPGNEDSPLTITQTALFQGRLCEVAISGNGNSTAGVTLTAQPAQLRMDEYAMFPDELHVYHNVYYVICSCFPQFSAIPDGYDIDTLLFRPNETYFDHMTCNDGEWTWISRERLHICLSIQSGGTEYRFSAEAREDGTVLITWTF